MHEARDGEDLLANIDVNSLSGSLTVSGNGPHTGAIIIDQAYNGAISLNGPMSGNMTFGGSLSGGGAIPCSGDA